MNNNKNTIGNAVKWSSITEIVAKLVAPISNMILARLLTPNAFGVVATATMIFSFADMFTDSGFQKYLVQHEFNNEIEREQSTTVAFWTNLFLSLLFWGVIAIFGEPLAKLVGNPGLGNVFIVSCISLPLTSFSSIQIALYRRNFDFKTLFYVRMVAAAIPLFVTVPLAFLTRSYWALIIGTICGNLSNALILTWKSNWKPRLFYSFKVLKKMFSFSIWSLVEAVTIWLGGYLDVFIVGAYLSVYYLGLYKTSMNTVNQIMNLIIAATTNVLFAALSREQANKENFEGIFFSFQSKVGLFILPMGVGIFLYKELVTKILLGSQWGQVEGFIGLWGLVNAMKIILSNYCSEAYRAMGKPKVSVFVQTTQIIALVPAIMYGAKQGFETLYVMRSLVSLELILVNLITIWVTIKISPLKMMLNILPEIGAVCVMAVVALGLQHISQNIFWNIFSIVICALIYFAAILLFPASRKQFMPYISVGLKKVKNIKLKIK